MLFMNLEMMKSRRPLGISIPGIMSNNSPGSKRLSVQKEFLEPMYKMPRMNRRRPRRMLRKRKPGLIRRRRAGALRRQVHSFKRVVDLGSYTASASALTQTPISKSFSFALADLPNVAEYTGLFDQYKLTGISLKIIPRASQFQGAASGTVNAIGYNPVITALDFDDAATPSSKEVLMQYGSCKFTGSNRIHKRYFKPKILQPAWVNAISSGYASERAKWIDIANTNVAHYGLKWWVDAPALGASSESSISFNVMATYYFMMKNTR